MTTRVAIVTQDDPFYVPQFFEPFFPALTDDVEIVSVTLLDPFDESFLDLVRRMCRLYGPVNFVRRGVAYVSRKAADAAGFGNFSVSSVAARYQTPCERRNSINTEGFIRHVDSKDVDVVLSVSAPEIFQPDVLSAPSWGCLNVHTAKLPKYRGMLPTFWALYHGEDEVGVTVHTMSEELDQGEIVRQTTFPVGDDDTLDDVIKRGKQTGGELAAAALDDIATGTVSLSPMTGEESYFSFPTRKQRREFQQRGRRLL